MTMHLWYAVMFLLFYAIEICPHAYVLGEYYLLFHFPFALLTQDFSDPRDADDARYALDGRDVDGSRVIVEFAKGVSCIGVVHSLFRIFFM